MVYPTRAATLSPVLFSFLVLFFLFGLVFRFKLLAYLRGAIWSASDLYPNKTVLSDLSRVLLSKVCNDPVVIQGIISPTQMSQPGIGKLVNPELVNLAINFLQTGFSRTILTLQLYAYLLQHWAINIMLLLVSCSNSPKNASMRDSCTLLKFCSLLISQH